MPARAAFVAALLLAAALRFPDLASRPMHADEAIHADKLGTLLEGGGYAYDPAEYHGPTLYYLTLPAAWLRGERGYADIDEVTLRAVPAALGVALVASHAGARRLLGAEGAAAAALLAAVSPAMVFYSRYFIHETLLVFFSFGALLAAGHSLRSPGTMTALGGGVCAGLMLATKETASLALACMVLAFGLTEATDRHADHPRSFRDHLPGRRAMLALLAAMAVAAMLFSSLLTRPEGLVDAVRAYGVYLDRAGGATAHVQPWSYYLRLLVHSPSHGTVWWTEGLIVFLAVVGGAAGWRANGVPGADSLALRFLVFYTLTMFAAYSAIPYKTPWCVLGILHGLILLAGAGAVWLVRSVRARGPRVLLVGLLLSAGTHLGWQAYGASFRWPSDPRNPYVYGHTGTGVFEIVGRLKDLARAHPAGASLPLQVISRENLWPLPFYLRGMPGVAWWNGVSDAAPNAPVVLVTPDLEPALVRKLYDLPAPGERELYVGIFDRPVELRPGVEVRGYAAGALWEDYRRLEPPPGAPVADPRE